MSELTPSEMADILSYRRDDLDIHYGNTGGGVMCIVAFRPLATEQSIYFGVASGVIGWSDELGENHADWDDYGDQSEPWQADRPIPRGSVVMSRMLATLNNYLPRDDAG